MTQLKTIITISALAMSFCLSTQAQTNVKKEEQSMKEVCNFLKQCGEYFLATVEGDQPRVRPFGTAAIYENRLYIQTGKRKNVAKQMLANPKVEICAYDKTAKTWVRIAATVVPDERIEAKQFMLDEYPSLKRTYSATDDNTFVLYLSKAIATFYSIEGEPRTVTF
jgi:uncharacterized pyridoxamine 5'-phosphate oxidase family protein